MASRPLPATIPPAPAGAGPALDERVARLVGRHQRAVFAYLASLGCPDELAEDLAQETFVAALRGGLVEPGEGATRAWLRAVARSRYLDHLRRGQRVPSVDLDEVEAAWRRFEKGDGGAAYLEALRACLAALAERERRALELFYREGLERARVAQAVGLSLGRRQGARERLRAHGVDAGDVRRPAPGVLALDARDPEGNVVHLEEHGER